MSKIHSINPNNSFKTRCGLAVENSIVRNITSKTFSACKRCLVRMKWERTGNRIIISENERDLGDEERNENL